MRFVVLIILAAALAACSGTQGKKTSPPPPRSGSSCLEKVDSGTVDLDYYQIGACPVGEQEDAVGEDNE